MTTPLSPKWYSLVFHTSSWSWNKLYEIANSRTMDNKTPEAENAHPIILKQNYNYRLADESDGMIVYLPDHIHVHWLNEQNVKGWNKRIMVGPNLK